MKEFKDCKDRTWRLDLTCEEIERVQDQCGVNLLDLADPDSDLLRQVNTFPPMLAKLLYAALKPQADEKGCDESAFRRGMNGDALAAATDCLLDEIVNFCPPHRRKLLQEVLAANREVDAAGIDLAIGRVRDPENRKAALAALDARITRQMQEALQALSGAEPSPTEAMPKNHGVTTVSETGSSTAAGTPPACSVSTDPAAAPGGPSSGSPADVSSPSPG